MAGLDAIGADHHFFNPAIVNRAYPLKVRIEAAFGKIMGVADIMTYHGFFPAYFTYF
jgi:hypothetical protein